MTMGNCCESSVSWTHPTFTGSLCSFLAFLLSMCALGVPLFSKRSSETDDDVSIGAGIWGVGFAYKGASCDGREQAGLSCYDYTPWWDNGLEDDYYTWIKVAECASVASVFAIVWSIFAARERLWPRGLFAAGMLGTLGLFLLGVPFGLWEYEVCGINSFNAIKNVQLKNDCGRSWSYVLQVGAFFCLFAATLLYCLGHKKGQSRKDGALGRDDDSGHNFL